MTMTLTFKTAATVAALAFGISAPAFAQSQLIASAGLTPAEARGLTLTEIAQAKFNREADSQDRQPVTIDRVSGSGDRTQLIASAGLTPTDARGLSLTGIAIAKYNNEVPTQDRQGILRRSDVTMGTRSAINEGDWAQLVASAGLSPEAARGLSLDEIAVYKFNNEGDRDARQSVMFNN
jgi:hypothetical protein